jgi:hypothetical protein
VNVHTELSIRIGYPSAQAASSPVSAFSGKLVVQRCQKKNIHIRAASLRSYVSRTPPKSSARSVFHHVCTYDIPSSRLRIHANEKKKQPTLDQTTQVTIPTATQPITIPRSNRRQIQYLQSPRRVVGTGPLAHYQLAPQGPARSNTSRNESLDRSRATQDDSVFVESFSLSSRTRSHRR